MHFETVFPCTFTFSTLLIGHFIICLSPAYAISLNYNCYKQFVNRQMSDEESFLTFLYNMIIASLFFSELVKKYRPKEGGRSGEREE